MAIIGTGHPDDRRVLADSILDTHKPRPGAELVLAGDPHGQRAPPMPDLRCALAPCDQVTWAREVKICDLAVWSL